MQVSALRIYPIKSTAGLDVDEVAALPWGLADDRRWMVVDRQGSVITARVHRMLLHVTATPRDAGGLLLQAPGCQRLVVPIPRQGAEIPVRLSRLDSALDAGDDAARWMSDLLATGVRLVWMDDPRRRTVSAEHGGIDGDSLNLADAGPVLVTTDASLTQLDAWLAETAGELGEDPPASLPMERFRPNIVVLGVPTPFAEDAWERVRIGPVEMRLSEPCDRCMLPTVDIQTLRSGKEPTRTLALRRQWNHSVHFGIRMVPVSAGILRVGDRVEVLDGRLDRPA